MAATQRTRSSAAGASPARAPCRAARAFIDSGPSPDHLGAPSGQATDRPYILLGSPGGSRIPEYVAWALVAMLDTGADPAEAAALPHLSDRNGSKLVLEEGAVAPDIAEALAAMGHQIDHAPMTSGLHILRILPDGTIEGGADPRREGVALGD